VIKHLPEPSINSLALNSELSSQPLPLKQIELMPLDGCLALLDLLMTKPSAMEVLFQ